MLRGNGFGSRVAIASALTAHIGKDIPGSKNITFKRCGFDYGEGRDLVVFPTFFTVLRRRPLVLPNYESPYERKLSKPTKAA